MNKLAQISALTLAAGFATAGSLDLDRAYATELKSDASVRNALTTQAGNIAVTAGTRFSYGLNFRDNDALGDDDTTLGFGFNDVEVRVAGQVTDNINATISFDFGPNDSSFTSGGSDTSVQLEDAYADWTVNDSFTLRVGQFVQSFSGGRAVSEYEMMNSFRSVTETVLGDTGWSQGIEAHFGGDTWAGAVGFSDGPRSANTSFDAAGEADFAFNGRFDIYSDSDKARFDDRAAWRGQSAGWRVGAGAIYATYGETNPSGTELDSLLYTIDGAYEADGWGVNAAFFGANVDPDAGDSQDHFGFELGGNFFFTDQVEGFARFDMLIVDDSILAPGDEDTYSFLSGGINYYFVPESHAAKFVAEVGYAFEDSSALSGLPINGTDFGSGTGGFIGDSDSGEIFVNFLMQVMF